MKNTSLLEKQAVSKSEPACGIPFSRREFGIIAITAASALSDADVMETLHITSLFETDDQEIEDLKTKLNDWLDV